MNELVFGYKDQESLWKHMFKQSLILLGSENEYKNKRNLLLEIEENVKYGRYSPNIHGFLSSPKSAYVARFVPLFSYADYSTYFACVQSMKHELASRCVEGTFGGWSMGGESRKVEERRAKKIFNPQTDVDEEFFADESMSASSFQPWAWVKEWNQYWLLLNASAIESDSKTCFVMFDIANFYDSIDLNQLDKKLRACCPDKSYAIEVLFHILYNWNRKLNKYARSTKGLPQDVMGDFSRHLSHFYLSEFDSEIKKLCDEFDSKFIRYADDMVVVAPSAAIAQYILFKVCESLHNLGLNVNTAKVRFMNNIEFDSHWGFGVMKNFEQGDDEFALKLLKKNWNNKSYGRRDTGLKRAITRINKSSLRQSQKEWVYNKAFSQDGFILKMKPAQINSLIRLHVDPAEAARKVSEVILGEQFTEPKACLINFLHRFGQDKDLKIADLTYEILQEIGKLKNPLLDMSIQNSSPLQDFIKDYSSVRTAKSILNLKTFVMPVSPAFTKVMPNTNLN